MMDQFNGSEKAIDDPYSEIPVLDLGPYLAGEKGALEDIGAKVRHIQETIGFGLSLTRGVLEKLERTYTQLKRFFALPDDEKLRYRINELSVGYVPSKSTKYVTSIINENTKKDLNETLITALERKGDHPLIRKEHVLWDQTSRRDWRDFVKPLSIISRISWLWAENFYQFCGRLDHPKFLMTCLRIQSCGLETHIIQR